MVLEIFLRKGEGIDNNPTKITNKGDPTALLILFYIIIMKKFGGNGSDEKFIT